MNQEKKIRDASGQRMQNNRSTQRIKFDRRDKKIYLIIALIFSVSLGLNLAVVRNSDVSTLPDVVIILCWAAFYPLLILTPAVWIRFFDVCLYLKRLKRYGYEVPEDARVYDRLLEKLPRSKNDIQKKKINDSVVNTIISSMVTGGILFYCIWYRQKYQWEHFYLFNYIGASIWCIVTLRYALQISDKKYKADLEPDDTRKTRESVMEAVMGIFLLLAFSLVAISYIIAMTQVAMKTVPERSVTTEISIASTEEKIDYEDETRISQLIMVGDMDIDIYQADTLLYYYHPNEENGYQEGADFVFYRNGTYGNQDVVTGSFWNTNVYTMILKSNVEQIAQIGIQKQGENFVQCLSDFKLEAGDLIKLEYSIENCKVYHNDSEVSFEIVGDTEE